MDRDKIMALANQTAGQHWMDEAHIQRFAHLVYESVFRDANIAASRTILAAAILEERERCCKIIYSMAGSDNVAQRTVDAIRSNP